VQDLDLAIRSALLAIAAAVLEARRARRWSQRRLAREAGISQTMISAIERAVLKDLPIATAVRVLSALDVAFGLRLAAPLATIPIRDAAHARCVAYVARRLRSEGFEVRSEVEVRGPGWVGSIDVLAYHPVAHILLVIEVKTELHDLGALDRQLGRYERAAWVAARVIGWRPRAVTGVLLTLATQETDRRLATERSWFAERFPMRAAELRRLIHDPEHPPERGRRGLAMIDPRSRRAAWLQPTWLDHRRSPARYSDRASYLKTGARTAS
jgi:transcriptional regulator with XRE-family HTH domain